MIAESVVQTGLIIMFVPILVYLLLRRKEKGINKATGRLYKKGIFVIIGKEHYKLLKPLALFALGGSIYIWLNSQLSVDLIMVVVSTIIVLLAFLERDKLSLLAAVVFLAFAFWSLGFKIQLPVLEGLNPIFAEGTTGNVTSKGFFYIITSLFLVIFTNAIVGEKPEDLLKGRTTRPLTPMEKQAVREHLRKHKMHRR